MISWLSGTKIFLFQGAVDLRKSYDSLAAIVNHSLGESSLSGSLFLFVNKDRNRLKILFFDSGGYCLFCKRLETGRFRLPNLAGQIGSKLSVDEVTLSLILKGFDPNIQQKLPRYKP